jgi:hypothetical protein
MATRNRKEIAPKRIRGEANLDERMEQMMNAEGVAEEISNQTMNSEMRDKT